MGEFYRIKEQTAKFLYIVLLESLSFGPLEAPEQIASIATLLGSL